MHLTHLSLTDFRSYPSLDLLLAPGVNTFVGSNGQGKTNLLEAVGYLATLGSHRVASDAPLVREGAMSAALRARIVRGDRAALVEIEIIPGRANRAQLNRSPLARPRDVLGLLVMVLFAPEDLALVKGDPAERRRFLDDLLVARTPRLAGVLADYERVLRQRSTLLRTAGAARRAGRVGDLRTLDVWDSQLARYGSELLAARLTLVEALRSRVETAYSAVAASPPSPARGTPARGTGTAEETALTGLAYRSTVVAGIEDRGPVGDGGAADRVVLEEAMLAELARVRPQEIDRGVTLAGPHRDELLLSINGRPARGYASHGESWSLALALKLASFELLRDDQREPVLLLDDVFAELDAGRRVRLAELVAPAEQVLVTAAVGADVPAVLAGTRFEVADGQVSRVG
ncbi:DNA replication/repair protein RecF [Frankia sp. Cppng1_Ct_nod]|uniref:DNA replication/repair protein RecF n=1 Tax=Frankia sp. Cppng1_Ct_nod TaxID=2897162 RepID=UPI002025859B|nr:DNA replication/repair protein RecF [Frankia sp. Cppng1_Ct_nod]